MEMTPYQAQVWARYHKAGEMLADATDELIRANMKRREGIIGNTVRYEQIAIGVLAEYRAARAALETL